VTLSLFLPVKQGVSEDLPETEIACVNDDPGRPMILLNDRFSADGGSMIPFDRT